MKARGRSVGSQACRDMCGRAGRRPQRREEQHETKQGMGSREKPKTTRKIGLAGSGAGRASHRAGKGGSLTRPSKVSNGGRRASSEAKKRQEGVGEASREAL